MALRFDRAEYVRSAGSPDQFLRDALPQFVFAGRSNVGKSSVINRLLGRKNLARVGASPGKTRQVNYFLVDGRAYLVDLPGYGYAKVPQAEKERWGRLMESFFQREGDRITAGVLIVDARHKPTRDDVTMHRWFVDSGCREIVVANKLDKLKKSEIGPCLDVIRETLELPPEPAASEDAAEGRFSAAMSVLLPFSAEKGTGREELTTALDALVTGDMELTSQK